MSDLKERGAGLWAYIYDRMTRGLALRKEHVGKMRRRMFIHSSPNLKQR